MSAFVLYLHFGDEWRQFVSPEQIQGEGLIMSSQYSNQEMPEMGFYFILFYFFPEQREEESLRGL